MIKISIKGLAEFIVAAPARQRKILHDFKYPKDDEPQAKILYYREARDSIVAFHREGRPTDWLDARAELLASRAAASTGGTRKRLKNNYRALVQYGRNFGHRTFEVLPEVRSNFVHGGVRITVAPDLHVREAGKEKWIKLDFGKEPPKADVVKLICQLMYEVARGHVEDLTASSVVVLDVGRGAEFRGASARARTIGEIKAACLSIAAIWPTL